ncbi:hypothetical protein [Lentzea sp. NPDC055074]
MERSARPSDAGGITSFVHVHVEDAARATPQAVESAVRGASNERARQALGWKPRFPDWHAGSVRRPT